jgi:hypothetical protein
MPYAGDTIAHFLRASRPAPFCDACLALKFSLSLQDARKVIADLAALDDMATADGTCSFCGRSKPVIAIANGL